ncbi:hypothetical protein L7F22_054627 [Adiantum nelumboides]|nr:hypothetical protein [Adiantum nelumboides]
MKEGVARCQEWLSRKNRPCAAAALPHLPYCGNHKPADVETRIPCPVDPSHTILEKEAEAHSRRCPSILQTQKMKQMPYYFKGANAGSDDDCKNWEVEDDLHGIVETTEDGFVSSKFKRLLFNSITKAELTELVQKVELAYELHCIDKFQLTVKHPIACNKWFSADMDRRIPFQKKHVLQQASMLGNMESFGLLRSRNLCINAEQDTASNSNVEPVFVEFGAGRGYLAHMLADCYIAQKIIFVERRSYKFKADRTLRQNPEVVIERVRIDSM